MRGFEEQAFRRSLEASERRRAEAKARRRQQDRIFLGIFVAAIFVIVFGVALAFTPRDVPAAPSLTVRWLQYPAKLTFDPHRTSSDGQCHVVGRLALRPGRPLGVATNVESRWRVGWGADSPDADSREKRWIGSREDSTQEVRFWWPRHGLAAILPHSGPDYCLQLEGLATVNTPDGRNTVKAGQGEFAPVWISPHIRVTKPQTAWHERAVTALEKASGQLSRVGNPTSNLKPPHWEVVSSFEDSRGASDDRATYLAVAPEDVARSDLLPVTQAIAKTIARDIPRASIKLIVRFPGRKNSSAVMRVVPDGNGRLLGWLKERENEEGRPLQWSQGAS